MAAASAPRHIPLFHPNVVSSFATTLVGLQELEESRNKTVKVSLAVFALSFVATTAIRSLRAALPKKMGWALLGIGVIGSIASALFAYKAYNNASYTHAWKVGFELLARGEVRTGMIALDRMLRPEYRWPSKLIRYLLNKQQLPNANELFQEKAYHNFATLDVRDASAAIDKNSYFLKNVFANAMIWSVLHDIKTSPMDYVQNYSAIEGRIAMAICCSHAQRCGSTKPQKAVYKLLRETLSGSELQSQVNEIPLPTKISMGHGLLAEIFNWIDELTPHSFDAQGKVIRASFLDKNGFANLKLNLEKAKSWLIKDNNFAPDSTEEIVINAMLNSSTLYELYQAKLAISPEQRQELRNKVADYDRPFPT